MSVVSSASHFAPIAAAPLTLPPRPDTVSHRPDTILSDIKPPSLHHRYASYASGASTPDVHSDDEQNSNDGRGSRRFNPKSLVHSTSAIGLDEMIEDRRCDGDLTQNVVHIEVPFGKPIEEVYDGVHSGPVLGSGISGLVRLVTHKATGLKYAVKVLDLGLVDSTEGLQQLREEIFIMCQVRKKKGSCPSHCLTQVFFLVGSP